MTTAELITAECNAIKGMLLEKNARYGDSAMQPRRIFSRADHLEQLKVRIDDKLSRIATMGPDSEDEDTTADLIGYLVLLRIARRRARQGVDIDDTLEPWEAAIPEQDVQRREQVATGSPIMDKIAEACDKIAEACGLEKADVKADFKGVSFALDAEPVKPGRIYRVPDRTSRATLPDECLGALCGRGGR